MITRKIISSAYFLSPVLFFSIALGISCKDQVPKKARLKPAPIDTTTTSIVVSTSLAPNNESIRPMGQVHEGRVLSSKGRKKGFLDANGSVAVPFIYDGATEFWEGLAAVYLADSNKMAYIDQDGHIVLPFKYDVAFEFHEGLAVVRIDDKYGFIDKSGKTIIPLKYDLAQEFSNGLALVTKKNKCGFIDQTGKIVVPLIYDGGLTFSSTGIGNVELNGHWTKINTKGEKIL